MIATIITCDICRDRAMIADHTDPIRARYEAVKEGWLCGDTMTVCRPCVDRVGQAATESLTFKGAVDDAWMISTAPMFEDGAQLPDEAIEAYQAMQAAKMQPATEAQEEQPADTVQEAS